jgi:hypothetical protein
LIEDHQTRMAFYFFFCVLGSLVSIENEEGKEGVNQDTRIDSIIYKFFFEGVLDRSDIVSYEWGVFFWEALLALGIGIWIGWKGWDGELDSLCLDIHTYIYHC